MSKTKTAKQLERITREKLRKKGIKFKVITVKPWKNPIDVLVQITKKR